MSMHHHNLIYALKNGLAVSIDDVKSGLQCGCTCPACGEALVAKKGDVRMHHFAHKAGQECAYGYESSLHLAAKEILSKATSITLPAVYLSFPNSGKDRELLCPAKTIPIDSVDLERRFHDVVPDIVIHAGGKELFVEIYVTHAIDTAKLAKLKQMRISTIEIDLSKREKSLTYQELGDILLGDSEEKSWKYNALADHWLQRFYRAADRRAIVSHGLALHINNCPLRMRTWRGKPYANYIDDCFYCAYCISSEHQGSILCSGKSLIAKVKDFSIPEKQRIIKCEQEIENRVSSALSAGCCPRCGGKLVQRSSQYGVFLGCSNYPDCRFTASIDWATGEVKTKW